MAINIKQRDDYNSGQECTWCSGCGNVVIWYMLKEALLELNLKPEEVVIVYGIGCSGNGVNFTKTYAFHGLHGRALPVAQGIKSTNPNLKVIVMGGDGDGMGIGVGHFIHACRRNIDITYILHDNQIYGLTTGQASPRSDLGMVTKTTPDGNNEIPVNPITLGLTSHGTFLSRSYSGHPHHLKDTLKSALKHKGFSLVQVLQPCITFNKKNTYAWFNSKVYEINQESYDKSNKFNAFEKAMEWDEKIPLGIFYEEERDTFTELNNLDIRNKIMIQGNGVDVTNILADFKL